MDEVNAVLLHERMEKPLLRLGPPEARALREGREALKGHLAMMEALLNARDWLTGRRMSQADLVAGGATAAAMALKRKKAKAKSDAKKKSVKKKNSKAKKSGR